MLKKWYQFLATVEEANVAEIKIEIEKNQKKCDEDLARAEPAVFQAEAALDTLNKVKNNSYILILFFKNIFN